MDTALILSALLMGLAGSPHCIAMCGAACAAVAGRCGGARPHGALLGFHAGRLAGYATGGAVVAASVSSLGVWAQWSPALRPLWTLVHAAALALGVWLLLKGRQPAFLENVGRGLRRGGAASVPAGPGGWQPLRGPAQAGAIGLAWLAWPCGLLQSALVVAGLGRDAASGAAIMAAFAIGSSLGLWAGPALWWRWSRGRPGGAATGWFTPALAIRLAGAGLAAASAWALFHDLAVRAIAYCFG